MTTVSADPNVIFTRPRHEGMRYLKVQRRLRAAAAADIRTLRTGNVDQP